jgi:hypothetical protein
MAQRKKLTPIAIARIRSWVEQGFSADEIARNIGCTIGTLRVRCSQLKISLRHSRHKNGARVVNTTTRQSLGPRQLGTEQFRKRSRGGHVAETDHGWKDKLLVLVSEETARQLQNRAALKGLSDSCLAATLLERIAQDDLYDAILDE